LIKINRISLKKMIDSDMIPNEPNELEKLLVIDRLEIGPVQLTKNRLKAPYRVRQNNDEHTIELMYRFEENVFQPGQPASENLASIMAAQVGLNYGLFCKEIIFHGLFDKADRKFIVTMLQNTAREIYVKKFLEPNPFLTGEAARLPAIRQDDYVQARIRFAGENLTKSGKAQDTWLADPQKYSILSSGGKDSLLSYGLTNEMGLEVHPVFINESGRHWYTAINAYRYFKEKIPYTARVWTNSDRIFNWMLRHFPFIRKDYASLRADEYPIRLWTVAVFLFGALPLLRKRGIGRLMIGDEFDTSRRLSYQGITHYDGLYDQSRYFDNTLTRYFVNKGWGITQFSLLRYLSELLIEKILVERYPHLQQHQMSCHAAHIEGDRVLPCGQCEKCHRIVAMLVSIDGDPGRCGYTKAQIDNCLKNVAHKAIHQESGGVQHLKFLLAQKNKVNFSKGARQKLKEHPEILKVRIDPEHAPYDGIPRNIRPALFEIFMAHAEGVAKRSGRLWLDIDPFKDLEFNVPYQFDKILKVSGEKIMHHDDSQPQKVSYLLAQMTWPEARRRFKEVDIALLPVGSIEQHGPHLPLDTDSFDAQYLARQVAAACSSPKPLVFPLIPYGVSYHHDDFTGTISISNDTLSRMVYEIGMSAAKSGITKLIIINGHGGNVPTLKFAAQMINRDARIFTTVDTGETSDADLDAICETANDVHAGEIETSTSLFVRPHLVNMRKAKKFVPEFSIKYLNFSAKRSVEWFAQTSHISPDGVLGDPTKATAKKGEKMWKIMIKNLVELVESLKNMSLDEIHEKRL